MLWKEAWSSELLQRQRLKMGLGSSYPHAQQSKQAMGRDPLSPLLSSKRHVLGDVPGRGGGPGQKRGPELEVLACGVLWPARGQEAQGYSEPGTPPTELRPFGFAQN